MGDMQDIREIRRQHLMRLLDGYPTQRKFAEAVGLAPAHISQMVTATREIGNTVARRIEQALGLALGSLDRAEPMESVDLDLLLKQTLTSDKLKLLRDYEQLSPRHQEMVRETAAAYVSFERLHQDNAESSSS